MEEPSSKKEKRELVWITYVPPEQETKPDEIIGESVDVDGYRIKLYRPYEPAPTVEVRNLFHKIYGEPQDCGEPNPYVAEFTRIRGRLTPVGGNGKGIKKTYGTVDFRYWPTLKLGYIENAQVNPEVRRKGLGSKLIIFAMNYLRNMGSEKIYAYAASREGAKMLDSIGFTASSPDNMKKRWLRWFYIS